MTITAVSRKSKQDIIFDVVVFIICLLFFLAAFYPLYFVIIASVSDPTAVSLGKVLWRPVDLSIRGYTYIFNNPDIWMGYGNTILYTVCGTLLGTFSTLLAAYALSRDDLPGRGIVMKLMLLTMFFNGGMIPTYLVVNSLGMVNTRLILVLMGAVVVYNIIIARTFFASNIPKELFEAASIDGCGNTRFFFTMVLPLSKAIVAVIALYIAIAYWNSYFNALIYVTKRSYFPLQLILREILILGQTLAQSGDSMDVEAIAEMQKISETIKYGVIIVSMLPVMCVYPFIQKYFVQGVMIGSVKG
ncbi:carbohydrate ABC transporter permease [Ruminococcaceae bacterium OttesenSCG-928-L11]|nr:carbohydrate ABC transporter permease [Ruminococcaceae bacterium OttesenSCG-928-L11]